MALPRVFLAGVLACALIITAVARDACRVGCLRNTDGCTDRQSCNSATHPVAALWFYSSGALQLDRSDYCKGRSAEDGTATAGTARTGRELICENRFDVDLRNHSLSALQWLYSVACSPPSRGHSPVFFAVAVILVIVSGTGVGTHLGAQPPEISPRISIDVSCSDPAVSVDRCQSSFTHG